MRDQKATSLTLIQLRLSERLVRKTAGELVKKGIKPLRPSMCRIQRELEEHGSPTLGVFRPFQIKRLLIEPADEQWSPEQLNALRQGTLFQKAPVQTLEKLPYDFSYEFRCGDVDCRGHTMKCTDWELGQSYRRWRKDYGEEWESALRKTWERDMIERYDTHFFVGTIHNHPNRWIIVGLFYPPKQHTGDLFDGQPT
jgi:hypothetical protein